MSKDKNALDWFYVQTETRKRDGSKSVKIQTAEDYLNKRKARRKNQSLKKIFDHVYQDIHLYPKDRGD